MSNGLETCELEIFKANAISLSLKMKLAKSINVEESLKLFLEKASEVTELPGYQIAVVHVS